jgi:hypothetical protein
MRPQFSAGHLLGDDVELVQIPLFVWRKQRKFSPAVAKGRDPWPGLPFMDLGSPIREIRRTTARSE